MENGSRSSGKNKRKSLSSRGAKRAAGGENGAKATGASGSEATGASGSEATASSPVNAALDTEADAVTEAVLAVGAIKDAVADADPSLDSAADLATEAGLLAEAVGHRASAAAAAPLRAVRRRAAARQYERARRTWYTLLFVPVFMLFGVIEMVQWLSFRLRKAQAADQPKFVRFRRPQQMPIDRSDRSVSDVVAQLEKFPYEPLPLPSQVAFYREYGADGVGMLLISQHATMSLPHLYPGVFKPRLFEGVDGVQLAGLQAMHATPGPALIICHGLLTTKNFDYIRRMALRAYSDWGFHVITIDLRSFGQSAWTSDAPSSAGYMEGKDVVEIARELQGDGNITSVGVLGYSLGGCTVLNAAHEASIAEDSPIDGGVLAVSAPTDVRAALDYISERPPWKHPFFGLWLIFSAAVRSGIRKQGLDRSLRDFNSLVEKLSLPYYKVDYAEFTKRCSPTNFAQKITVPTLQLHAQDDFVVPVEHADKLHAAADGNDNVHVWVVDRGSHCAFSSVDARWYYSVVRRWFEYWADEPPAADS